MSANADLVVENGRIFIGLDDGFAQSLVVFGNRVLATSSNGALDTLKGPATRTIDLAGRAVVPGINDGHQHLLAVGMALGEVDLRPSEVSSLDEVLAAIKAKVDESEPGEWIFGGRYDHFHLDIGRHPFREELDRVSPNNPVFVKRTCGHMGVANSRALEAAGVVEDSPEPQGGHISSFHLPWRIEKEPLME